MISQVLHGAAWPARFPMVSARTWVLPSATARRPFDEFIVSRLPNHRRSLGPAQPKPANPWAEHRASGVEAALWSSRRIRNFWYAVARVRG